jgi:hypothetical protein
MKRISFTALLVGCTAVASVAPTAATLAQGVDPACPAGAPISQQRVTQDACQKAIDVYRFMVPQLGISVTGGNTTLGQGGALGGPGHFTIGLRANGLNARLPKVDEVVPSVTGAVQSDYAIDEQLFGLPAVDAGVGIFKGLPVGVTNVLALDVRLSASYVPEVDEDDFSIKAPDGSLKVGFGGRVGIVQESFVTPSVSVSYLRRDLPVIDIAARSGSDSLFARGITLKTDAFRVVAGKSFVFFGLAAGIGQDRITSASDVSVRISRLGVSANSAPVHMEQKLTRTTMFADLSIDLPLIKIVGEIGRTSGGDVDTYNTFSGKQASDALTFASVGLRLAF